MDDAEYTHLNPARWWFASSAFPMVAGTLGPCASAFSICALVKPWRMAIPPGADITKAEYIDDPPWLIVTNAVQLALALAANLALLLNMSRKIRFTIAQPVTILGWYCSSLTLVVLLAAAAAGLLRHHVPQHPVPGTLVWSQAFYYAIYSALVYFLVASLMLVTFAGAYSGRYPKDFVLSPSQRTLMLQTIMFLAYLLLGALLFSNLEKWSYLDAVYWADVTLFTVGFGDLYPQSTAGRALLFPYALVGIISLGLVVGSIRSLVLERGKRRLGARMVERKRRDLLRRIHEKGMSDILVPVHTVPTSTAPSFMSAHSVSELERRELEFNLMRKIQRDAADRRRWTAMAVSTTTWLVLWLVGAKIFQDCEADWQGWNYFDGVYFAFVSLTTIGYGDVTPLSAAGKSFFVFWSLMALPTTTVLISNAADTVVKWVRDSTDLLGNVTILPGERGFRKDMIRMAHKLTCGILFDLDAEESSPGFLGSAADQVDAVRGSDETEDERQESDRESQELAKEEGANKGVYKEHGHDGIEMWERVEQADSPSSSSDRINDSRSDLSLGTGKKAITFSNDTKPPRKPSDAGRAQAGRANAPRPRAVRSNLFSQTIRMDRSWSSPRATMPQIPERRADLLVTLIDEIARVTRHLKARPPRKYTFREWAWYLKLIGEDEASADTHRQATRHRHRHRDSKAAEGRGEGGEQALDAPDSSQSVKERKEDEGQMHWSWIGHRSPLMSSQEEAEWILDKLEQKLAEDLRFVRDVKLLQDE